MQYVSTNCTIFAVIAAARHLFESELALSTSKPIDHRLLF